MNVVILDESRFQQILANSVLVSEFSFMKAAAERLKSKGCKCSRSTTAKARDYTAIKQIIAKMTVEKKRRFKELLGADRIQMTYTNERRLLVQHEF